MAARVDYILVERTEWVESATTRYKLAIDYREALVTLMPRLHSQIMSDIPNKFGLDAGRLQRIDTPHIPREVIREAVANILMHRDYRSHQPTQVIRYSNRLEFKNAGYSLKPIENFGETGSRSRNPVIAGVFHELKDAETKGTGIRSMRKFMLEAGLSTPPIIESDRDNNEFDLILFPHHLLDHSTLIWLSHFKDIELSDAQRRALAFVREVGAITNQDYRQLNGTDTLTASASLRKLREVELLVQKGKGNSTYYTLGSKAIEIKGVETLHLKEGLIHEEELTPHTNPAVKELTPPINLGLKKTCEQKPSLFLDEEDKLEIISLGQRPKKDRIKN